MTIESFQLTFHFENISLIGSMNIRIDCLDLFHTDYRTDILKRPREEIENEVSVKSVYNSDKYSSSFSISFEEHFTWITRSNSKVSVMRVFSTNSAFIW